MSHKQQKIVLNFQTASNSRQVSIENGELKIGRGENMDLQIADAGLSRHHASIHRDGAQIWILDCNSTNGSFVNDAEVSSNGTRLKNGDTLRLGNEAIFTLQVVEEKNASQTSIQTLESGTQSRNSGLAAYAPFAVIAIAVVTIGLAILIIASRSIRGTAEADSQSVAQKDEEFDDESALEDQANSNQNSRSRRKTVQPENSNSFNSNANVDSEPTEFEQSEPRSIAAPPAKIYLEMTDAEKRAFIEREAVVVARMIGNRSGEVVPPAAVERIKDFIDVYARRLKKPKLDGACNFTRDNLETLIERASQNARFIVPAFNSEGLAPQIGLYLAMIESEHCICLQSPTGPLGMFQFTRATGANFGLETKPGASPANPDERCTPHKAAPAAARYMKFLSGRYGTGALSVPLAIASYNSGEGGLSSNLQTALAAEADQERSFWTLVANQGKLSEQFQKENVKYVPKFFAAAIVGENPSVFGVKMPPISSNTR